MVLCSGFTHFSSWNIKLEMQLFIWHEQHQHKSKRRGNKWSNSKSVGRSLSWFVVPSRTLKNMVLGLNCGGTPTSMSPLLLSIQLLSSWTQHHNFLSCKAWRPAQFMLLTMQRDIPLKRHPVEAERWIWLAFFFKFLKIVAGLSSAMLIWKTESCPLQILVVQAHPSGKTETMSPCASLWTEPMLALGQADQHLVPPQVTLKAWVRGQLLSYQIIWKEPLVLSFFFFFN